MKKFFRILDSLLDSQENLFLIGGAAVVLGYKSDRLTKDSDAWMSVSDKIREKWAEAVKKSGINLYLEVASVAQAAYGMEERASVKLKLKNLNIVTPSALDLIIMKVPRLSDNDRLDIGVLIKETTAKDLLQTFKTEFLPYCIGNKKFIAINYLEAIETHFGQKVADREPKELNPSELLPLVRKFRSSYKVAEVIGASEAFVRQNISLKRSRRSRH